MAPRIECLRCGGLSASFVKGVCRACYMREYRQAAATAAAKDKQMVFEPRTLSDSEGPHLCVECKAPDLHARGRCYTCYMRGYMRERHRRLRCAECGEPGIFSRGLCRNCYVLDRRQRQRFCVECGRPSVFARSLCRKCYMRERQRAAKSDRTNAVLSAIDGQRKAGQALAGVRREASTLADLKAERATLGATGRQIEAEGDLIRYVAEAIGAETDSERTIRWLLALIMMWCDPPARALRAAESARDRPQSDAALPKIMEDVLQAAE
jgi:hypothetical protein